MKILKTVLLSITFISAALLWFTKDQYMSSLSAFALSDNAMYYRAMHLSMIGFFIVNAISLKKYVTEYAIALGLALVLMFDMYNSPVLHNVFTVGTLLLACVTLLINVRKNTLDRSLARLLVACAVGIFLIGYVTEFHFLLAEILAMLCIATGKLIEIHEG